MLFKIQWQKVVTYEALIEADPEHFDVEPQYDLTQIPSSLLLEFGDRVVETVVADELFVQECQKIKEVGE